MFKMKKLAAIAAAAVMAVSAMAVSASASTADGYATARANESQWYLQTISGAPSSVEKTNYIGTVSGLRDGTDTGVTVKCTYYKDNYGSGIYAIATLTDSRLNKYSGSSAQVNLDNVGDKGTLLFQNNWYNICYGTVNYQVQGYNFVSAGNQQMRGSAY